MKCPFCGRPKDRVVDSRESKEGDAVRRRRLCLSCRRRYTTYERIELISYMVHKKDGSREPFDRNKLRNGLVKACYKRPIPAHMIDKVVGEVEARLHEKLDKEIRSSEIGELVMSRLKDVDKVAYVRFASVYREFADIHEFMREVKGLMHKK